MLKNRRILKTLFIFTAFILSLRIYGYGLVYEGEFIDPTNSENTYRVKLLSMANASESSKTSYNDKKEYEGQWILSNGTSDKNTTGSTTSYGSFYIGFYTDNNPDNPKYIPPPLTDYDDGFVSSGSNSNIYYDNSTTPITPNSDSFVTFRSNKANIARNQGTTMDGLMKVSRDDESAIKHLQWRVTNSRS